MFKILGKYSLVIVLISFNSSSSAQEVESFLACGEIPDRVERVLCLETALEQSAATGEAPSEPMTEPVSDVSESANNAQELEDFGRMDTLREDTVANEEADTKGFKLPVIGNLFRRNRDEDQEQEVALSEDTSADRLENFGRGTSSKVIENAEGQEELIDVVTELTMAKPNTWLIRLASGQVWRQTHTRRYNLRKGDEVRIYPTQWGENYRLETERLSGFIQMVRVE
ncbi:MAG: hypothetical protein P8J44_06080 [Gammaproteobacteria bacterium]|nr:hypothetical protein [Gammaproteobacteria bacterium]